MSSQTMVGISFLDIELLAAALAGQDVVSWRKVNHHTRNLYRKSAYEILQEASREYDWAHLVGGYLEGIVNES